MYPKLNFYCELDTLELRKLFNNGSILPVLKKLNAGISLAMRDFSHERAEIVKEVSSFGIPVIAWLILPEKSGDWSNIGSEEGTFARYDIFKSWSVEHDLKWQAVGLGFEHDILFNQAGLSSLRDILYSGLLNLFNFRRYSRDQKSYKELATQITSDGFTLEAYQLPFIVEDRLAKTRLIQRFLGIFDFPADREILMLYSSVVRPIGAGFIWSYGQDASLIGLGRIECVGKTSKSFENLNWGELERDLRLAWHWVNEIYIVSLEGCVQQNILENFLDFEWDGIILEPTTQTKRIDRWRISILFVSWLLSYLPFFFGIGLIITMIKYMVSRKRS